VPAELADAIAAARALSFAAAARAMRRARRRASSTLPSLPTLTRRSPLHGGGDGDDSGVAADMESAADGGGAVDGDAADAGATAAAAAAAAAVGGGGGGGGGGVARALKLKLTRAQVRASARRIQHCFCVDVLDTLVAERYAAPFLRPVTELWPPEHIRGYTAVIAEPCDLGTIRRRLADGVYMRLVGPAAEAAAAAATAVAAAAAAAAAEGGRGGAPTDGGAAPVTDSEEPSDFSAAGTGPPSPAATPWSPAAAHPLTKVGGDAAADAPVGRSPSASGTLSVGRLGCASPRPRTPDADPATAPGGDLRGVRFVPDLFAADVRQTVINALVFNRPGDTVSTAALRLLGEFEHLYALMPVDGEWPAAAEEVDTAEEGWA